MKDLTRKTVSALAWLSVSHGLRVVFQIGVILVLSRLLGPEPFGVVAAAGVVILVAQAIAPLGLAAALVAVPGADDQTVRAVTTVSLGFAALLSLGIGAAAPLVERQMGMPGVATAMFLLLPVVLIAPIKQISLRTLHKRMAYRAVAVADAFLYLVLYGGLSVVLALGGWGFRGLVIAQTVSELASAILMLAVSRAPLGLTSDLRGLRPMLSYGLGLTAANAADSLAEGLPKVFAGNALGAAALGCYGRAWDVTRRLNTALEEVSSKVLFPAFALRQDSPGVLGELYARYLPVSLAVMIPVGVILAAAREEVVLLLLGRGWEQAVVPFGVLALLLPIQSTRKITLTVLNSLGRSGRNLMVNAATCGVVLVLLPFAVRLGLPGVAWAIFLASLCGAVLAQGAALRALGVRSLEMIRAQAPPLLDAVLVAGGCWAATVLLHRHGVTSPIVRILAIGVGGALAGGLGLLILPQAFAPVHLRELFNRWWVSVLRLTRRLPPWDETKRSGSDG